MGPLLFIMYVNDFSRASALLFSILFADDTNVFIEGIRYEDIIFNINNELEKISVWLGANKLCINVKKTHYMVFHRSKIKKNTDDVIMCNNKLTCTTSTKFLGLIIDNKLNWSEHIMYIKNKISKSVGILFKTRNYVDKTTLRNLYFTFIYPYLIYCVEIWGNARDIHLNPLIKTQKKVAQNLY